MPELPEVETTRLAISPYLLQQRIKKVVVRHHQLRLPIPALHELCVGQCIETVQRRAKYLLLKLSSGYLLIHLGMSGHLRLVSNEQLPGKHDHIDLILENGVILRYNDPRRFGLWIHFTDDPEQHPLLNQLGPEPLSPDFNGDYLNQRARKKTQAIKTFIMDNHIVVGVGNIYASESLFFAGIHPTRATHSLTKDEGDMLVKMIKEVLQRAIEAGGTTLRDFFKLDGKPGYFLHQLQVYGRKDSACYRCNSKIEAIRIAGRNSAYCPTCQV